MKTGREKFAFLKTLISIAITVFKFLPKFLRYFIWDAIKPFSQILFIGIRYVLLKSLIKECGDNIRIGSNVQILGWQGLQLGSNISIHNNCYIDSSGGIVVKDNVSIAHNTSVLSTTHSYEDERQPIKYNKIILDSVNIQSDVWVGCGCRILAGVNIGERSIIAAGAVVNKDVTSKTIVGGVPAKKIKDI